MVRLAGGCGILRPGLVIPVIVGVGLLLSGVGCFWLDRGDGVELVPAYEDGSGRVVDVERQVMLTKEASELRRVRGEHERLIESIPTVAPVEATKTKLEVQSEVIARIVHNPEGLPFTIPVDEDWFDAGVGLRFFRPRGGDWTNSRVRKGHSHRLLFYYERYPEGVANFSDKSIYRVLARELAFEASGVMPLLGDPTPALVSALEDRLGWELRATEGPVVNVWSWVSVRRGREEHEFAIGGVMRMGVASQGEGDEEFEYLTVGEWLGPVVVERLQ